MSDDGGGYRSAAVASFPTYQPDGDLQVYYHKDEREEFIQYLADKFPKCFFDEPSHRRPLKHDILDDLDKQKVLDREKLTQTLDWYQNHFVYRYGLIAGAERVDLEGNKAGFVTEAEQRAARAWIAARKREMKEQQTVAAMPVIPTAAGKGHEINGAAMPKIAATTPDLPRANHLPPALSEMQAAIGIINNIMTERQYEPLRPALATAALKEIIGKAERLISSLGTATRPSGPSEQ
jgi:ProP effector